MAKNDTDYAIVVGINNYPDTIGPLKGAVRDAQAFADWLGSETGGDVPEENIFLIPDSADLDLNDIGSKIQDITTLGGEHEDEEVGRRLYLFFSGHGISDDSEEAWLLLPQATDTNYLLHSVAGRTTAKALVEAGLFQEVVLFMDCCRNQVQWVRTNPIPAHNPNQVTGGETIFSYAFASAFAEKAREANFNDHPDPAQAKFQGIFTTSVLEGLNGNALAKDDKGHVTAESLRTFVIKRVVNLAQEKQVLRQRPRIDNQDGDQIIFVPGKIEKTTVEVAFPTMSSERKWFDGSFNELGDTNESEVSAQVYQYKLQAPQLAQLEYLDPTGNKIEIPLKIEPKPEGEIFHVNL